MPRHVATRQVILTTIEAVEATIGDAERELRVLVETLAFAPRADKTLATQAIRDAFMKLRFSRGRLAGLERLLADNELERISAAIVEAEKNLDQAIDEMKTVEAERTLMPDVVSVAFTRLEAAKEKLRDLEAFIAADED